MKIQGYEFWDGYNQDMLNTHHFEIISQEHNRITIQCTKCKNTAMRTPDDHFAGYDRILLNFTCDELIMRDVLK